MVEAGMETEWQGLFAVKPGWQVVWDQKCRTSVALLMTFGGKSEKNFLS